MLSNIGHYVLLAGGCQDSSTATLNTSHMLLLIIEIILLAYLFVSKQDLTGHTALSSTFC